MRGFTAPSQFVGAIVKTKFGVFASVESDEGLYQIIWSEPTARLEKLRDSLVQRFGDVQFAKSSDATVLLDRYFEGEAIDFQQVELNLNRLTPFRRLVTQACRNIPIGSTASYAELAKRAGSPGAARAVGSTMANNPWPIIVPCHRVFASGGQIGGYSAPGGLSSKRELIERELKMLAGRKSMQGAEVSR